MHELKIYERDICVITMKNNAKFEEELTYQFKIGIRIWWILTRALKSLKTLYFNGLLLTKVYNVWVKKIYRGVVFDDTEDWCKIWKKTELCFENFDNLKNSDFILKSKTVELNQNKNSKWPDWSGVMWRLYFTLETNEWRN